MTTAQTGPPPARSVDVSHAAVGLGVNADHLSVEAVDLAGERVLSWRRAFPGLGVTPSRAVASILSLARTAVARVQADGRQVAGLAVGVPGLVDPAGVVTAAPILGWRDVDLRTALVHGLGIDTAIPLLIDDGATLGALAEYRLGSHAGTANLVALSGEVGVGAGIISDGRPVRVAAGYAGQIGHLSIDPGGPECPCGRRGCLEAMAGIPALIQRLDPQGAWVQPVRGFEPEVTRIVERATCGDTATVSALEQAGAVLGHAAAVLVTVLNPEVVILGGYYVALARWLLPAARIELAAHSVAQHAGGTQLVASRLAHGAAALGGTARIRDAVDAGAYLDRAR